MPDEREALRLGEFFKGTAGIVVSLTGLVSAVASLVSLIKRDPAAAAISLIVFAAALWFGCLIVVTARIKAKTTAITGQPIAVHKYSSSARHVAMWAVVGIPVVLVVLVALWLIPPPSPNDRKTTAILVAEFSGPDAQSYRITETLVDVLHDLVREFPEAEIVRVDRVVGTPAMADSTLKAMGGFVLLWGWYGRTSTRGQLSVNYRIARPLPANFPELSTEKGTILYFETAALDTLGIQRVVSRHLAASVLFLLGQARFAQGDHLGSIERYNSALNNLRVPLPGFIDSADVLLFRGLARSWLRDLSGGIGDYSLVIRLRPRDRFAYFNRGLNYEARWPERSPVVFDEPILDSAIQDYSRVLQVDPDSDAIPMLFANAAHRRGHIYFLRATVSTEALDSAMADFETAFHRLTPLPRTDSVVSHVLVDLAAAHETKGQLRDADRYEVLSRVVDRVA